MTPNGAVGAHDRILGEPDRELYEESDNGMHAWAAYARARRGVEIRRKRRGVIGRRSLPIPEWVLEYFDECYARLNVADGTKNPDAIAKALRLHTSKGGKTARERGLSANNRRATIQRVTLLMKRRADGMVQMTDAAIYKQVATTATRAGIVQDWKTVRNLYREWSKRAK
jgi:hypothetical protein